MSEPQIPSFTLHEEKRVTFLFPGTFWPEERIEPVDDFDPKKVTIPENCFAFEFSTGRWVEDDTGTRFWAPSNKEPGRVYVGGEVFPADALPEEASDILQRNALYNGWKHLIRCRTGNWQPFTEEDRQVAP